MSDLLSPPLSFAGGWGDHPGSCVSAVSPTHKIFAASVSGHHDHNHQWVNSPSGFGAAEGHSLCCGILWAAASICRKWTLLLQCFLEGFQPSGKEPVMRGGLRVGVGGRGMRGLDGYAGSEPGPHTKEREGLRLCLFLTLCLVRDRSTEHRWKVKRGQSVQEMDTAAAAGGTLTCKEVFSFKV